jgi:hypothetical protein
MMLGLRPIHMVVGRRGLSWRMYGIIMRELHLIYLVPKAGLWVFLGACPNLQGEHIRHVSK